MAQLAVVGPLGERDLRLEPRPHPVHAAPRQPVGLEWRRALTLSTSRCGNIRLRPPFQGWYLICSARACRVLDEPLRRLDEGAAFDVLSPSRFDERDNRCERRGEKPQG